MHMFVYYSDVYSVKQAAERLGLSDAHVRRLLESGQIAGQKVGSYWVVLNLDYKRRRKSKAQKGG